MALMNTFNAQPLCRYCGKPIPKKTQTHYFVPPGDTSRGLFYDRAIKATPRNREEAQRHLNQCIVSVRYTDPLTRAYEEHGRYIEKVTTWDGESYADPYFCNGKHASRFGSLCARFGHCTPAYNAAANRAQNSPSTSDS